MAATSKLFDMSGRTIKALQEFTKGAKTAGILNTLWLYDGRVMATDTYHFAVIDMPDGWKPLLEEGHVYKPESDVLMKMLVGDAFRVHKTDEGELMFSRVPSKGDPYNVPLRDVTDRCQKAASQMVGWAKGDGKPKPDVVPTIKGLDPKFVTHVCDLGGALGLSTMMFDTFFDGSFPMARVTFPERDDVTCVIALIRDM